MAIHLPCTAPCATAPGDYAGMVMKRASIAIVGALVLAAVIWALRSRRNPTAYPYGQSVFLEMPRPFLRRAALQEMLAPVPGERLLEIGPGTGYYTLDVADAIGPRGRLDILDVQQEMLDATLRRAGENRVCNVFPTQGDARALPYLDATFDAAFLVATLGEAPDKDAVLGELRRVLKPSGRLVVGEGQPDPHMVRFPVLRERAAAAGFQFEERTGGRLGFLARFRAA